VATANGIFDYQGMNKVVTNKRVPTLRNHSKRRVQSLVQFFLWRLLTTMMSDRTAWLARLVRRPMAPMVGDIIGVSFI
jgi:hypothetical protein